MRIQKVYKDDEKRRETNLRHFGALKETGNETLVELCVQVGLLQINTIRCINRTKIPTFSLHNIFVCISGDSSAIHRTTLTAI